MPIDRQFVITQQGKDYVLYGGLLDEAHRQGLKDIETTLAQVPGPENGHVAIVTATVRLVSPDGIARHFQGIGDASADNVSRLMVKALIRMAETRAKARALRDAINVAGDLLDDLPDAGTQIDVPDKPDRPSPNAPTPPQAPPSPAANQPARTRTIEQARADLAAHQGPADERETHLAAALALEALAIREGVGTLPPALHLNPTLAEIDQWGAALKAAIRSNRARRQATQSAPNLDQNPLPLAEH